MLSKFALEAEIPNNSIRDIRILKNFKKDETITITKSDKGNVLVVMDTDDCKLKLRTLLRMKRPIKGFLMIQQTRIQKKFKLQSRSPSKN